MNLLMRTYRRAILPNPANREDMLMFADMLEEHGHIDVAHAYRWAANFQVGGEYAPRWPFVRTDQGNPKYARFTRGHHQWVSGTCNRVVCDWECEDIATRKPRGVPVQAKLPVALFTHMRRPYRLPRSSHYGGVHRAFKLLAWALKELKW